MTQRQANKTHGVLYYVGMGLSIGLFAFVVLVGVLAIVVPAATGSTPMTVLTGSMSPTYPPGTLIIVKPVDAVDIHIGDSITYQIESGKPAVVTHRVVAITTATDGAVSFQTKGDANNAVDEKSVIPEQIRGKVWYALPYLGYVNTAVNGEARGWLIPLIAIGLFVYVGYLAASGVASKMRKDRHENNEDDDKNGEDDDEGDEGEGVDSSADPAPMLRDRSRSARARH